MEKDAAIAIQELEHIATCLLDEIVRVDGNKKVPKTIEIALRYKIAFYASLPNRYGVNRDKCIHIGVFAKSESEYLGIENPTEWCKSCHRLIPIAEL